MRWLARLFGFFIDCVWAVPVALWRGLTGYVPPDPWQAAAEVEAVRDEIALDAETESLMAQVEAAERRIADRAAAVAAKARPVDRMVPLVMEPANDDTPETGFSLAM